MFGFVKWRASRRPARALACLSCAALLASVIAACGGDSSAPPARSTAPATGVVPGVPTPAGGLVTVAVPSPPPGATPFPPGGTVPPDCESVTPTSAIAALVARDLVVVPGRPTLTDGGTTIVCRYLVGKDASMDRSVLLTVSGYASEAIAAKEDAGLRAAITAQGGVYLPTTGVGDEGYSLDVPALTGISGRIGSHVVTLGVGKSIDPPPTTEAVTTLVQRILSDVGR